MLPIKQLTGNSLHTVSRIELEPSTPDYAVRFTPGHRVLLQRNPRAELDGSPTRTQYQIRIFECLLSTQTVQSSTPGRSAHLEFIKDPYLLKCFVVIDLKTCKLSHQDIGQMDMSVRICHIGCSRRPLARLYAVISVFVRMGKDLTFKAMLPTAELSD